MKKIDKMLISAVFAVTAVLLLALIPGTPSSSDISNPVKGTHYTAVSEKPIVRDKAVMFFWYGCLHCKKTYEVMEYTGFEQSLSEDGIKLRRIPVAVNETWELHARLFYALEEAGLSSKGHAQVMELIQDLRANKERDLARVLDKVISDEQVRNPQFNATTPSVLSRLHSSAIEMRLKEGEKLVNAAQIQGVPVMLVNGKSTVTLGGGVTYIDFPAIAIELLKGNGK